MRRFCAILVLVSGFRLFAAEVIPPPPAAYFNDYASVVSPGTLAQLNQTLENFERQSSEQIVVAVFPKMQSDSSIDDYAVRVFRSWQVGQKDKNNGAVLFVFVQDHKMFLEVGYGLEGVLPDALCKRIIDEQIAPRFKAGDFDGGLTAGVQAILAATRGEYKGTGTTVAEHLEHLIQAFPAIFAIAILILIILVFIRGGNLGRGYSVWTIGSGGSSGGWGGGYSGGGGFSGGGGGGFSGGGGSCGGGGAGGGW
ncbi:MAG: TPM domain-containing protein [Limisphaerales bacterium]